jgi:hypothetical protein
MTKSLSYQIYLSIALLAAASQSVRAASGYISDTSFTTVANGWGPVERDMSNGEKAAADGKTLTIAGTTYPKGLGVHAASEVHIDLGGACSTFTSDIGVDSEVGSNGAVVFQVWADGSKLFESGILRGGMSPQPISVPVPGKHQLSLVVSDGGSGINNGHADWGGAKLDCSSTVTPAVAMTAPTAPVAPVSVPSGARMLNPGDDVAAAVSQNGPGTTFYLRAGTYRLQSVEPKANDVFTGDSGAVISGARLLTSFSREGGYWVAAGQDQHGTVRGLCSDQNPLCNQPEDLFFDDNVLQRVASLSQVSSGKWFFDYGAKKIYFGDDPSGHKVETSVTASAFHGSARGVAIRGLVIEKYANPSSSGSIHAMTDPGPYSSDWVIDGNEIRLNHAAGVRIADRTSVTNNKIHDNGQIGVIGGGSGVLIEGNEIYSNNIANYDVTEAGGTKFVQTNNLVVRGNYVHDNNGPGLWTDSDNTNPLYENNHTRSNRIAGIFHEMGTAAIIRNNTVEQDGHTSGGSMWYGAGIFVHSSSGVEIYGNTVTNCESGIGAAWVYRGEGSYDVKDLNVHDNVITQSAGAAAGIVSQNANTINMNNHFQNNTYILSDPNGKHYEWNGPRTKDEWRSFGNDVNGTWR